MSGSELTVRDILANARSWIAVAEEATRCVGNDFWQDMTVAEFGAITMSDNPIGQLVRWDAMASTLRDIETLPDAP